MARQTAQKQVVIGDPENGQLWWGSADKDKHKERNEKIENACVAAKGKAAAEASKRELIQRIEEGEDPIENQNLSADLEKVYASLGGWKGLVRFIKKNKKYQWSLYQLLFKIRSEEQTSKAKSKEAANAKTPAVVLNIVGLSSPKIITASDESTQTVLIETTEV